MDKVLGPLQAESSERKSWIGIPMLPSGCFTESSRLKAIVYSRTRGTIPSDRGYNIRDLSTEPHYPERIQQIKDVLANVLQISAYSIDTVLYNRKASAGHDETTAMGKILVSFNPDVRNNPNDHEAAYEVWAGAVVENGVATSDDSTIRWPIMYDSWSCADLTDPSQC